MGSHRRFGGRCFFGGTGLIDPIALYRDLLLCVGPDRTPADMARDYKATFSSPEGQRVLAHLWSGCAMTKPYAGDAELRVIEARRSLIENLLQFATAKVNEDGTIDFITPPDIVVKQQPANGAGDA
ncbi:MAG: hypothetical protein ACR2QF_03040 [Geminicoccaceae bacterium]